MATVLHLFFVATLRVAGGTTACFAKCKDEFSRTRCAALGVAGLFIFPPS